MFKNSRYSLSLLLLLLTLFFNACSSRKVFFRTPEESLEYRRHREEQAELRRQIEADPHHFYFKHAKTTIVTEKDGYHSLAGALAKLLQKKTGQDWNRSSGPFSISTKTIKDPSLGKVEIFRSKVPKDAPENWYRITVSHGILIQSNSDGGYQLALEHFSRLIEGEDESTRIPKGFYSSHLKRSKTLTK